MPRSQPPLLHLLELIAAGEGRSQRRLAARLSVALGRVNRLIVEGVRIGWLKTESSASGPRYVITAAGRAAIVRMSRDYLAESIASYEETRARLTRELTAMARAFTGAEKRVAFFGANHCAEIAYAALQETDLRLVGVYDDARVDADFFGLRVGATAELRRLEEDTRIVVTSLVSPVEIRRSLDALGIPEGRICWL
jgi:DNA-binding MarR family transcriptional regulator